MADWFSHTNFFLLTLAFILLHEMDAVRCQEWRIFPLTSFMQERTGMLVFYWLHIPLFMAILYFSAHSIAVGGDKFSFSFSIFCIAHAFVHWAFERHPKCEFKNPLSRSIIWGAAVAGVLALLTT
ncbi:MAG: DUF6713 family protein [Rhizobiaceae bacterium]